MAKLAAERSARDDRARPGAHAAKPVDELLNLLRPFDEAGIDVLSAVSHQLRTPLTSIVGFAELLADGSAGPLTEEQHRILDTIVRNISQLMSMIDGLTVAEHPGAEPPEAGS